ncbi:unnamed protein product [Lactuca saligna]|uniref:Uncharacterized protein n=1 Tax=Lactuca saligna TaxID=75948 RepID=A0AA36ELS9_LACSI|nr:unnamed protein product [Lactuca saligna]
MKLVGGFKIHDNNGVEHQDFITWKLSARDPYGMIIVVKERWQNKNIIVTFHKDKWVLDQLENKEAVEVHNDFKWKRGGQNEFHIGVHFTREIVFPSPSIYVLLVDQCSITPNNLSGVTTEVSLERSIINQNGKG